MTPATLAAMAAAGLVGFVVARSFAAFRVADPPERLMRVNVSGRAVPAVLGEPLAAGAVVAVTLLAAAAAFGWDPASSGRAGSAAVVAIAVMAVAGAADDRRGDERSRGFAGHLAALRARRLTGGMLKIVGGAAAAGASAVLVFPGDPSAALATLLLVPLGANAINLLDRAPGRASKGFLLVALPLMVLGDGHWGIAAAGAVGALVACLPFDLEEKAMLGDAGANPLGALLGLGLALSLGDRGRWIAVAVLVLVNAASERWSFSRAIERTAWLDRLDRIGRK